MASPLMVIPAALASARASDGGGPVLRRPSPEISIFRS